MLCWGAGKEMVGKSDQFIICSAGRGELTDLTLLTPLCPLCPWAPSTGSPYCWREAVLSLTSENTREVASLDPLSFLTLSSDTKNFGLPQH